MLLISISHQKVAAQKTDLNQTLSISVNDSTLEYFLNVISQKAGINFSYNPAKLPLDTIVTLGTHPQKLSGIFEQVFLPLNIEYTLIEQQVVLKLKAAPDGSQQKPEANEKDKPPEYTLSGYVKEVKSTETLIGATIYVEGTTIGTITNSYGFYSITLPEGEYDVVFSFIGLQNETKKIILDKNQTINAELFPDVSVINEIVVSAAESESIVEINQMSELKVLPKTLSNINGFMGEPDLIKAFQVMPGIKLMGDGSTSFFVRGGHLDQNLILIDEAPIYNAAHLFGFFSVFVNDAIKDIKIYKGDMPAMHGGRLSSLVNVKTKDGNMNQFHFSGNTGLVATNIAVEGPLKKQKSSFFISARRSHLRWLLGKERNNIRIYFYDINAKFNWKINHKNRLYFSTYTGKDYLGQINTAISSNGISWGNGAATLRWNHIFSNKLFSNFTFNASKYNYFMYLSENDNYYWNSSIGNSTLKADFTWYINPENTLKFGLQGLGHTFNPGNLEINNQPIDDAPYVPRNQATETALYVSNQQIISDKLSFRYGLRYTKWENKGPTTLYSFNDDFMPVNVAYPDENEVYNTYRMLEPRVNINFKMNEKSAMKASYVHTSQNIHLLSNSISPFTSLEVWFPSNPNIKPEKARQFALGYFRKNRTKQSEFTAELFYKKMLNQIDYKDHAKMLLNPLIEGELRFGTTKSYGAELSYRKTTEKLDAWIGYTFSRSLRVVTGINFGEEYPSTADRPHDFSVHLTYKTQKRWRFNVNWMYISGTVFSSPTSFYYYQNYTVPIYLYKNNDRFPDYHRMDVSAVLDLNKKPSRYKHHLTFGIFNLYGRKNPISINFTKVENAYGNYRIPSDLYNIAEIIPTKMSLLGFMPSLTYHFSF